MYNFAQVITVITVITVIPLALDAEMFYSTYNQ